MAKKTLFLLLIAALTLTIFNVSLAAAETDYTGKVVKVEDSSTLYYIASDGNRYIFPNEKTYKSWNDDFSEVVTITREELNQYPLAGNIRYRPGVLLVKFVESNKVYAVAKNGRLRWIKTEHLAQKLYGNNWNLLVDDIPTILFGNYTVGNDIDDEGDYDADEEINETETIDGNRGFALGHYKDLWKSKTTKCRAIPAVPGSQGKKATPAISARQCKVNLINDALEDKDAPVITEIEVETTDTTATITWTTDEESNSKVEYADESLTTASTTDSMTSADLVTSHSIELTGLTASTTYYFIVQSADANSNIATSTEDTFMTEDEETSDTTAPEITEISVVTATSTATITWTTNEAADSLVKYANESLTTAASPEEISDSSLVTSHSVALADLTPTTTYYFIVKSTDNSSNSASSTEDTFITDSE